MSVHILWCRWWPLKSLDAFLSRKRNFKDIVHNIYYTYISNTHINFGFTCTNRHAHWRGHAHNEKCSFAVTRVLLYKKRERFVKLTIAVCQVCYDWSATTDGSIKNKNTLKNAYTPIIHIHIDKNNFEIELMHSCIQLHEKHDNLNNKLIK